MKKHYAKSQMQLVNSVTSGELMDSEVQYFEINGNKYSISVDANAPAGEPKVFISIDGMKIAVESEYTGFMANDLCFDTIETASQETGLPAEPGYIHPTFDLFVEFA